MILIIDDDSAIRSSLSFMLKRAKYDVQAVPGPKEAIEIVRSVAPQLILMDMNFTLSTSGEEGLTLLKQVKVFRPDVPVILMTAWGSIQLAVQGMQAGGFDFITKPWNNVALMQRIETALELTSQDKKAEVPVEDNDGFDRSHIIGKSKALMDVLATIKRIARTNASVLITGESGTGKELIAEAVHLNSPRSKKPFVKVNLGGISHTLFESEMFGHKKGAFTDAYIDRTGRFEMANKGTIFLDEIGNLSYEVQIQLLRALQERKIRPVGSNKEISVDIRLVSATNENLEQAIEKGAFREDLYHRINEFTLRMPQLKDRREDILLFANFFLDQANREMDKQLTGFDDKASRALLEYPWPGNLRQMKNMVRRATLLAQGKFITINELSELKEPASAIIGIPLRNEEAEKHQIIEALRQTGNNKSRAAQLLGIDRKTLYNKLKLYNISDS